MATAAHPASAPRLALRRLALLPVAVLALTLAVGAGVLGLRLLERSGAFPVERVEVEGAGPAAREVRVATSAAVGSASLLAVDTEAVESALRALPHVRSVEVDRSFPGTLAVAVQPERPVAIAPSPSGPLVLAASGRVLGPAGRDHRGLPVVAAAPADLPGVGGVVDASGVRDQLMVAAIPTRAPRLEAIGYGEDGLVGRTAQGVEVRFGHAGDLRAKLAVARSVLRRARGAVVYVDVTVPTAPVLRAAEPNPITAAAPQADPAALPEVDLGAWVAGAAPAESIRTVFG
jgi:cell division protein FtsQ